MDTDFFNRIHWETRWDNWEEHKIPNREVAKCVNLHLKYIVLSRSRIQSFPTEQGLNTSVFDLLVFLTCG